MEHPDEAERGGRLDIGGQVIDEHAFASLEAKPLKGVVEDSGLGLAHADLDRDHQDVKAVFPRVPLLLVAPRAGQQCPSLAR